MDVEGQLIPPPAIVADFFSQSRSTVCLILDRDGLVNAHNPLAAQYLHRETLVGRHIDELLCTSSRPFLSPADSPDTLTATLLFRRDSDSPLVLRCRVYVQDTETIVIGESTGFTDDIVLRKISLISNELARTAREMARRERYGQLEVHGLKEMADDLLRTIEVQTGQLQESESRYRSLFQDNHSVMLLIDPASAAIVDANPAACSFYGYSAYLLTRKKITEINMLSEAEIFSEMERARRQQRQFFNFRHRLADGRIRDVEVYCGPIVQQGKELLYSIIHDVTERRRVEQQLVESEQKYRMLADHTYDWEYWLAPTGEYNYISPSCERVTGYSPDEFIREADLLLKIVLPEDIAEIRQHFVGEPGKTDGSGHSIEFRIRCKNGDIRWLEHNCSTIFDGAGTCLGIRGSNRDITRRKTAEEKRHELESILHQKSKMEAIGRLAGGMAHNFNNNLAIILGCIELLLKKYQHETYLENAKIAALRSRELIQNMLVYSRREEISKIPLCLGDVIDEVLRLLKSTIPSGVSLKKNISPAATERLVLGDRSQIHEVLINLCTNAVHAMDEMGEIIISLEEAFLQRQDLPLEADLDAGYYLILRVRDNGRGIDPLDLPHIFEPFYTTKKSGEGTGMGLATVQSIVIQLGGFIKAVSEIGVGTTFELSFPIYVKDSPPEILTEALQQPAGNENILFVDDDQLLAGIVGQILADAGYQVRVMTDSRDALAYFKDNLHTIDLVMTDLTMPLMSGLQLLREMLVLKPDLKTIICTANSEKLKQDASGHKIDYRLLIKPFESRLLLQTIRHVLDGA